MASASKRREPVSRGRSLDIISRVQRVWGESPFYQAQLKGPAPDRFLSQPNDPFTPDKDLALSIARGRLTLGDEAIDCEGELGRIWDLTDAGGPLYAFLQEFSWLRHLSVMDGDGCSVARQMMQSWLDRYEKWSPEAWAPYFVSERLVQLCAHHPMVLSKTDALWRSRVLASMARQTRHLARTAHRAETGFDRLMTSLGLCVAGYCLPGCEGAAERGLEMVRRELRLQLRPDGGHVSRNPSRQLKLAVRLQTILKAIEARGLQPPGFLRHSVARTSAMATFFRCADGCLAVFNGGYEDDGRAVLAIQAGLDSECAPSDFARHSGYHKLTAGRALVIVDTGDDSAGVVFKSAGSLHFSSGRSRLTVNCGNGGHRASQWRNALEQRAAHSALSFSGAGVFFGQISHRRAEEVKGQLLEFERQLLLAQSDDATYLRRLFLAAGGSNLRGEEILTGLPADLAVTALWRFHLHPGVRASLARDRRSVLLLLPNKEGWRFKSNCPALRLEKSVYCGEGGSPVASEQIVVAAAAIEPVTNGAPAVKWAFQRLDAV
jgi:uncharacterized heparinase superfamily protein